MHVSSKYDSTFSHHLVKYKCKIYIQNHLKCQNLPLGIIQTLLYDCNENALTKLALSHALKSGDQAINKRAIVTFSESDISLGTVFKNRKLYFQLEMSDESLEIFI